MERGEEGHSFGTGTGRSVRSRGARVRLTVLVAMLVVVAAWATDVSVRRHLRRQWHRPLDVAVVVLGPGGVPAEKKELIEQGLTRLETFFSREWKRHHGWEFDPVRFTLAGAIGVESPPPLEPRSDSLWHRAAHAFELARFFRDVHRRGDMQVRGYDARLYVVAHPAGSFAQLVEGAGEEGGDIGIVVADLNASSLELTLLAIGHELLHCLGASDKYDARGHTRAPQGLADPAAQPLYPQTHAENMVGELPLSPEHGRLPESLDEVRIGPSTALEIGWSPAPPVRAPVAALASVIRARVAAD